MTADRLQRLTRLACLVSAVIGLLIALGYCLLLISGRMALDFAVAPLAAGLRPEGSVTP